MPQAPNPYVVEVVRYGGLRQKRTFHTAHEALLFFTRLKVKSRTARGARFLDRGDEIVRFGNGFPKIEREIVL